MQDILIELNHLWEINSKVKDTENQVSNLVYKEERKKKKPTRIAQRKENPKTKKR